MVQAKQNQGRGGARRGDGGAAKAKGHGPEFDVSDLEFHRQGVAWLWGGGAAFAVWRTAAYGTSCSCGRSTNALCPHLRALLRWDEVCREAAGGRGLGDAFRESVWYGLAAVLAQGGPPLRETGLSEAGEAQPVAVIGKNGAPLAVCSGAGPARARFAQRCSADPKRAGPRGAVFQALACMTLTEDERAFGSSGVLSRRQTLEATLAYRLAYHGYRELGPDGALFAEAVDEDTGTFWLTALAPGGEPAFRLAVAPEQVEALRARAEAYTAPERRLPTAPQAVEPRYRVERAGDHGLRVRLVIPEPTPEGIRFLDPLLVEAWRFGGLAYRCGAGDLVPLREPEPMKRRLRGGVVAEIARQDVPAFLQDVGGAPYLLDASDRELRVHRSFDGLGLFAHALERDWCWISVEYGVGRSTVSLPAIRRARAEGTPFLEVGDGWLDCRSPGLEGVEALGQGEVGPGPEGAVRIRRTELLRLARSGTAAVGVAGKPGPAAALRRLVDLTPSASLPELQGLRSVLRPYQRRGAEWLVFLYENGLGGLLCDDMGLGKTHQVMALMVYLRERAGVEAPFLVICPATVLSHWAAKLRDYAPGLPQLLHHGGERDLDEVLAARGVVLTSYAILRNDLPILAEIPFALAVFDEAQNVKNPRTASYAAARALGAGMKLAVTGTPIENSVLDLKALMDLAVPGYLGSDRDFGARFAQPAEGGSGPGARARREELSRLVSPFTLRRLKVAVLDELPDKIEDLRTCRLSEEQVALYRDAVGSRSGALLEALGRTGEPVPYLHVFALLSTLKQICDHPALLRPSVEGYETLTSGKWDLFAELLSESLESGQKVVVFTHFLGMIEIMQRHLAAQGVAFATLTGKSRNRGKILERFQEDPTCRVFLASLKAGGAGIDLVAGSVVIHYDRWWNAAAEDQATDRVHRIGQTRGVQVFKLVTEGTLEEKIAAIIERKRALLRDVVAEDDPGLLKSFSRDELAEMLAPPE